MPASRRTPWLICYDIADPDRLRCVYKEVRRYATPLQHSVFCAHATRREVVGRLRLLTRILDPRCDDVRAYPLLTTSPPTVYGRPLLASGVHLSWQQALFHKSARSRLPTMVGHMEPDASAQGVTQTTDNAAKIYGSSSAARPDKEGIETCASPR